MWTLGNQPPSQTKFRRSSVAAPTYMQQTMAAPVQTSYGLAPQMMMQPQTIQSMGVPMTTMAAPTVI
jgi:hypothetical protein